MVALAALFLCGSIRGWAQTAPSKETPGTPAATSSSPPSDQKSRKERAAEQLKQEERQRILGVIPEFNTIGGSGIEPLTPRQKFQLAFKSATDPFAFGAAGFDAAYSQLTNAYPGYGQGASGYGKRYGASFLDSFDGTIIGNALFPAMFREDPRYFRKGTGTIKSRFLYAIVSTVRARSDHGSWVPNYGNVLGNLAAGGISNLYYPSTDRGFSLTLQRAFTVTAEGAFGALGYEFWPDVERKFRHAKR